MKIKKLTSVILAAMLTATAVPFNEVTVPYNSIASYAAGAEASKSVAEGTLGENIAWTLYDGGQLSISGSGAIMGSDGSNPWGEYTDDITSVVLEHGITEIGDYAFYGCENLIFVSLEYKGGLDRIGFYAFDGCSRLMDLEIGGHIGKIGDFAFNGCEMLDKITITNSDCSIVDSEFVFPENTVIEGFAGSTAQAYAEKYGKEFVEIGNEESGEQDIIAEGKCGVNLEWSLNVNGSLIISGEGDMDNWASAEERPWAEYTSKIKEVSMSEAVSNIGDYAFYGCENLEIGALTFVIGAHAYEGCERMNGYSYYGEFEPINEIKDCAFKGCTNLWNINILNPDCIIADSADVFEKVTSINGCVGSTAQAYAEKYNRRFVEIGNEESGEQDIIAEGKCGVNLEWSLDDNGSLIISGEGDMDNWASPEDRPWAEYVSLIRTVSMPEEVTSIGDYAFYGCENLISGVFTSVIGAHAYEGCKRMNVYSYYGDASPINEIKDCAFKGCYTLWGIPISNPDCIIADSADVFDNNTTIEGYVGSTAQAYAVKYERNFQDITLINNEGSCGENLHWYLTSDGMLGIGGSGKMQDYSEDITKAPWYSLAESITSIYINDFNDEDETIELSENCFAMCENVERIDFSNSNCIIADSAETIPENAVIWGYEGSTAQEYAEKYNREFETIPTTDANGMLNDEYSWELNSEGILYITGFGAMDDYTDDNPWGEYADKITSVYFYGNVTSIGKNAFSYCENLSFVDIDESIELIDKDAFSGCDKLEWLNFHGNKKCVIYDSASTIPAQTELIGHFGSPLHEYADKFERKFYWIDGDINEDSTVDSSDASMVLAEYSNIQTGGEAEFSSVQTTTADVTNDNVVDPSDASAILEYYAKASIGEEPSWNLTDVTK